MLPTRIDQAYIGSCANGTQDDLELAAAVLRGRRVASGVHLIVVPASQTVYRDCLKSGAIAALVEVGATIAPPTCGACGGGHMGIWAYGRVGGAGSLYYFQHAQLQGPYGRAEFARVYGVTGDSGGLLRYWFQPAGGAFAKKSWARLSGRALYQRSVFQKRGELCVPAIECPGVDEAFDEGDIAEIDVIEARVRNITKGTELIAKVLPSPLLAIVNAGGIYPLLEKEGSIAPKIIANR